MWQLTRVGGLYRILGHKCTTFGKWSAFDLLIERSGGRHSLDEIRQINIEELEALICNQ